MTDTTRTTDELLKGLQKDRPNVCVFGASSDDINQSFIDLAETLGARLAQAGYGMVFGGGANGLMGATARGVSSRGGAITGVTPLVIDEIQQRYPSMCFIETPTLASRKEVMEGFSDAFVVLPGGVGTLDELFNVAARNAVHETSKPLVIFNPDGFYDPLLSFLDRLSDQRFIGAHHESYLEVCSTVDEVMAVLAKHL